MGDALQYGTMCQQYGGIPLVSWKGFARIALLGVALEFAHSTVCAALQIDKGLPVRVADAIAMNKFSVDAGHPEADIARFSPDGRRFLVVVRSGNLSRNTNDYSLLLWRSEQVFRSSAPTVVLKMSSSSSRPAIQAIIWLADNETIFFLGEHPGELQQLYSFNLRTRVLRKITHHPTNLLAFSTSRDGRFFAFIAEEPVHSVWDATRVRRGVVLSTENIYQVLAGQTGGRRWGTPQLYYEGAGQRARQIALTDAPDVLGSGLGLSPDGRYILLAPRVRTVPEVWKEYTNAWVREQASRVPPPGEWSWLSRYEWVDTKTGRTGIVLDSPSRGILSQALWAPDSRSVILSAVFLPLDGTSGDERKRRQATPFSLEVQVPGGEVTEISHENLQLLGWQPGSDNLVFCMGSPDERSGTCRRVLFRKSRCVWEKAATSSEGARPTAIPELVLKQDMNTPPRLFARSPNGREALLFDPNPQFRRLHLAKEEEIHWKGRNGEDFHGGLYYPVNYRPGERYPLVIQTHAFTKAKFWIDGPWTTAFAAQPLAAKGMMVLQADESHSDSSTEVDREVGRLETAIDALDEKGLIDLGRIGLIGFSRTCLFVKQALIHSKYKFAAASVTDGVDGGYFQYLLSSYMSDTYEGLNGGLPWGAGFELWRERASGFHVEKVDAPLRITAERPEVALFEWEWYAALRRLRKPVEMVVTRDGEHVLQKPWERMVSQQGNVDWFAFWLKGEEDPDPDKAEQYARWRKLRREAGVQP